MVGDSYEQLSTVKQKLSFNPRKKEIESARVLSFVRCEVPVNESVALCSAWLSCVRDFSV